MDFKQYPSYKDSGVEWLGEVPEHWQLTKIKFLSTFVKGKNPEQLYDEKGKGMYSYLSMDYLRGKSSELFAPLTNNLTLVDDEQTLIIWDGSNAGEFVKAKQGILSSTMGAAFTKKVNKQFFWYLCLSIEPEIRKRTNGMGIPHVSGDFLKNFLVAMPNLGEQSKLAAYLDHETSKIDNLIAKQEKLIEKLEEHRKSLISHAVTKGLNPNVPMKDSGVEWLGEVPEHWILKKYKFACKIYRGKFGHRPRNDPAFYDGEYPFIQTGDIARANKFIEKYSQTLNELGKSVSQKFPKGTLVMAIAANIGDTAILDFEAYAPDSVVGFKPNKDIDLEFLRFSFTSSLQALKQTSVQSTQSNLNVERIGALKAVFPPFEEQVEISNYLNNENLRIDDLILKQNQLIEKLKEHRTSIISYAVTGKIDVRDLVA